jgi:hypothetical protein
MARAPQLGAASRSVVVQDHHRGGPFSTRKPEPPLDNAARLIIPSRGNLAIRARTHRGAGQGSETKARATSIRHSRGTVRGGGRPVGPRSREGAQGVPINGAASPRVPESCLHGPNFRLEKSGKRLGRCFGMSCPRNKLSGPSRVHHRCQPVVSVPCQRHPLAFRLLSPRSMEDVPRLCQTRRHKSDIPELR